MEQTYSLPKPKPRPRSFRQTDVTNVTTDDTVLIDKEIDTLKAYQEKTRFDVARNLPVIVIQENNVNRGHKEQDHLDTFKNPVFQVVEQNIVRSALKEQTPLDEDNLYSEPTKEVLVDHVHNVNRAYKETTHTDETHPLAVHGIEQNIIKRGVAETTHLDNVDSQLPKEVVIVKEIDLKPSTVTHRSLIREDISENNNFENPNLDYFDRYTTTRTRINEQVEAPTLSKTDLESTPNSYYRCDQT